MKIMPIDLVSSQSSFPQMLYWLLFSLPRTPIPFPLKTDTCCPPDHRRARRANHIPHMFNHSEWVNQHLILDFIFSNPQGEGRKLLSAQVMSCEEVSFTHGHVLTSMEELVWENGIKQEQKGEIMRESWGYLLIQPYCFMLCLYEQIN